MTNSLSVAFTCICSFLTSHTYLGLKDEIGASGLFFLYGAISSVGFLFILCTVPETKGKTEAEIAEFFLSKAEKRQRKDQRRRQANEEIVEEESPLRA